MAQTSVETVGSLWNWTSEPGGSLFDAVVHFFDPDFPEFVLHMYCLSWKRIC